MPQGQPPNFRPPQVERVVVHALGGVFWVPKHSIYSLFELAADAKQLDYHYIGPKKTTHLPRGGSVYHVMPSEDVEELRIRTGQEVFSSRDEMDEWLEASKYEEPVEESREEKADEF